MIARFQDKSLLIDVEIKEYIENAPCVEFTIQNMNDESQSDTVAISKSEWQKLSQFVNAELVALEICK